MLLANALTCLNNNYQMNNRKGKTAVSFSWKEFGWHTLPECKKKQRDLLKIR